MDYNIILSDNQIIFYDTSIKKYPLSLSNFVDTVDSIKSIFGGKRKNVNIILSPHHYKLTMLKRIPTLTGKLKIDQEVLSDIMVNKGNEEQSDLSKYKFEILKSEIEGIHERFILMSLNAEKVSFFYTLLYKNGCKVNKISIFEACIANYLSQIYESQAFIYLRWAMPLAQLLLVNNGDLYMVKNIPSLSELEIFENDSMEISNFNLILSSILKDLPDQFSHAPIILSLNAKDVKSIKKIIEDSIDRDIKLLVLDEKIQISDNDTNEFLALNGL